MPDYKSVCQALHGQRPRHLPRGEAFITEDYLQLSGLHMETLLESLQADIVTLPAANHDARKCARYWRGLGYFPVGFVDGPINGMIGRLGWYNAIALIAQDPGASEAIMRNIVNGMRVDVERALEKGIEAVLLGDDLAGKSGLVIDPDYLEKHYFPLFSTWLQTLYENRIPVLFHSDGDIRRILPNLDAAGFSGLYGLQADAGMKIESIPRELLTKWVFWGTFQFEGKLGMKAPVQVESEVMDMIRAWEAIPGYIFGSCGGLYAGLQAEAVQAAYGAIRKTGERSD